ncbi:MAG TPA: hypothetical protein VMV32_05300 [Ignavibacteriaceae bacterium]|nr:hypothetical protein [Ignavibacteriaceae bacterium]
MPTKKKIAKKPGKGLTNMQKIERDWEFKHNICDAILVQIDENLVYDYPIGDQSEIIDSIIEAVHNICGTKKVSNWSGPRYSCYQGASLGIKSLAKPAKIPKRILDGLAKVVDHGKEEYSLVNIHFQQDWVFGNEWFCGKGTMYRYRPGQREEAKDRIEKYFNKTEQESLKQIGTEVKKCLRKKYQKEGK